MLLAIWIIIAYMANIEIPLPTLTRGTVILCVIGIVGEWLFAQRVYPQPEMIAKK